MPVDIRASIRTNFSTWRQQNAATLLDATASAHTELPLERLGILVRSHDTSAPLARVPVYAVAEVALIHNAPAGELPTVLQPLGLLGTDHVGFASFDLTVLRQPAVREALIDKLTRLGKLPVGPGLARPVIGVKHLWVSTFVDPRYRTDALAQGEVGPNAVVLRVSLDTAALNGRVFDRAMAGMQNPSILDWRLSPSSFSVASAMLVGEAGCESFLPANLSTQQFRFVQCARTPHTRAIRISGNAPGTENPAVDSTATLGFVFDYTSEWFGIGHSLGQVQYSLPLAPAERVKIAVVDWSRQDRAVREEETGFRESLLHQWTRDRSVSETVHSVLDAWQRGGSVMGGGAGSLTSGGLGVAASLGAAFTTSADTREITADSTQRISDAFHQASSAERELRSTVVVTGTQAESSSVQTRMVANYNHSHALTILYYEVLRHYRVVTRAANARMAIFVDYSSALRFTRDFRDPVDLRSAAAVAVRRDILEYRAALEAALLDQSVRPGFDAAQKLACHEINFRAPATWLPTDDFLLTRFLLKVTSGAKRAQSRVDVKLLLKDGDPVECYAALTPPRLDLDINLTQSMRANAETWFDMVTQKPVRWGNVAAIEFFQGGTATEPWDITHVHACSNAETAYWIMADRSPPFTPLLPGNLVSVAVDRYLPGPHAAADMLTADERSALVCLMRHLHDNHRHYSRAIWRVEDPASRAKRLADTKVEALALLDTVDNTLLDVAEHYIVMPVGAGFEDLMIEEFDLRDQGVTLPGPDYIEQLLTLPARGVFAEAKLGHCNASEVIDTERFWDWQKSPIPDSVPDISGVSPKPQGAALPAPNPTAFPSSIINIATPTALPDPTGLKDSLSTIAALGQIRDASGAASLGSLLQVLSNNATTLGAADARNEETKSLISQIRNATELTAAQKTALVGKLLESRVQEQQQTPQRPGTQGQGSNTGGNPPASGTAPPASAPGGGNPPATPPANTGNRPVDGGAPNNGTPNNPAAARPPRVPLTERANPEFASWSLAFQNFDAVGAIAAVRGSIAQPGHAIEQLRADAPLLTPLDYDSHVINGNGKLTLTVHLANAAGSVLTGEHDYKLDVAKVARLRVKATTSEIVSEAASPDEARLAASAKFAADHPLAVLAHIQLRTVEDVGPVTAGVPTSRKYHFVALHEKLEIT